MGKESWAKGHQPVRPTTTTTTTHRREEKEYVSLILCEREVTAFFRDLEKRSHDLMLSSWASTAFAFTPAPGSFATHMAHSACRLFFVGRPFLLLTVRFLFSKCGGLCVCEKAAGPAESEREGTEKKGS